jgi:hypothetical protein
VFRRRIAGLRHLQSGFVSHESRLMMPASVWFGMPCARVSVQEPALKTVEGVAWTRLNFEAWLTTATFLCHPVLWALSCVPQVGIALIGRFAQKERHAAPTCQPAPSDESL